jgi:AcrR family transcriptional regulator
VAARRRWQPTSRLCSVSTVPGDAEQTKRRLLEAATADFAHHGIAGARVDRIAEAARTNKQMIYAYFGNKDTLFDAVFTTHVGAHIERVDFDAADLPAYAGRLFDAFEDDPAALRLSTWYRLERPEGRGLEAMIAVNAIRLDRLRQAQREGLISRRFEPVQLLVLIQSIATAWSTINPELGTAVPRGRAYRRATVMQAVAQLVAAA